MLREQWYLEFSVLGGKPYIYIGRGLLRVRGQWEERGGDYKDDLREEVFWLRIGVVYTLNKRGAREDLREDRGRKVMSHHHLPKRREGGIERG